MTERDSDALPCAQWARRADVPPIGTALSTRGFLLVEWPGRWPRDVGEVTELAPLAAVLRAHSTRLQLVQRVGEPVGERRELVWYHAGEDPWFAGYRRRRLAIGWDDDVVAAATTLITGDAPSATGDPGGDVLVCGHGSRDACCGSMGTRLAAELAARDAAVSGYRVWRSSHTGGHRFAPTATVLPEGTSWGFLDADLLTGIVCRGADVTTALGHLRGCTGLPTPEAQLVDRIGFESVGWSWLDHRRRVDHGDDGVVRLQALSPEDVQRAWEAVVVTGRRLPVPVCRRPLGEADKFEDELLVGAYRCPAAGSG